jgi:hypothetical protein
MGAYAIPAIVWEPACGPGAIVKVLREQQRVVIASGLRDPGFPMIEDGIEQDFFSFTEALEYTEAIITNPPYNRIGDFVRHALTLSPKVIVLGRLSLVASTSRADLMDDAPLRYVFPFARRLPMMHRAGYDGPKASSMTDFAWFVWERNHKGPTTVRRLDWKHPGKVKAPSGQRRGKYRDPHTLDMFEVTQQ